MGDSDFIYRFLDEYPPSIGMTKIASPAVYTYHGPKPQDWGISGFVLIAESHISIHTFPQRGYINIDVFSCKEFDADIAVRDVKETFSLSDVKVWTLERGLEYSQPYQAQSKVGLERAKLVDTS